MSAPEALLSKAEIPQTAASPAAATQLTLLMVGALPVMSGAVIAPSLPAMNAHFAGAPHADFLVRLLLTAPALAIVLSAPLAGYLLDRFAKKRILMAALSGFTVFGSAGLLLESLEFLLVSRLALGVSVAFIMAAATALVGDLFAPDARARFLGRQSSAASMAGMIFLIGGGLLAGLSWRGPFFIYLGALPLLLLLWWHVPNRQPANAGQVAKGRLKDEVSLWSLGGLYLLALLCMLFFYLLPTQGPFLIATLYEGPTLMTGIALAASTLGAIPLSLCYGRIRKLLSPQAVFITGFSVFGCGLMLLSQAAVIWSVLPAMLVCGMGFGLIMPNLNNCLLALAPARVRGRLAGGMMSCIFLGQFVSPVFSQPIVARVGYGEGFFLIGLMLVVVALGFLFARPRLLA